MLVDPQRRAAHQAGEVQVASMLQQTLKPKLLDKGTGKGCRFLISAPPPPFRLPPTLADVGEQAAEVVLGLPLVVLIRRSTSLSHDTAHAQPRLSPDGHGGGGGRGLPHQRLGCRISRAEPGVRARGRGG